MTSALKAPVSRSARGVVTVAAAAVLAGGALGAGAAAHATPGLGGSSTGKLVVTVVRGHHRLSGRKLCTYFSATRVPASACGRSDARGIVRLRKVTTGTIDLVLDNRAGKATATRRGVVIKEGETTRYTFRLKR